MALSVLSRFNLYTLHNTLAVLAENEDLLASDRQRFDGPLHSPAGSDTGDGEVMWPISLGRRTWEERERDRRRQARETELRRKHESTITREQFKT